jgi:hypothetical protein
MIPIYPEPELRIDSIARVNAPVSIAAVLRIVKNPQRFVAIGIWSGRLGR